MSSVDHANRSSTYSLPEALRRPKLPEISQPRHFVLPEISHTDGDFALNPFPEYLRVELQEYCARQHSTVLGNGVTRKRRSTKDLYTTERGRPAYFRATQSGEKLLAARFQYGDDEITIVKEPHGTTVNGGKAVLLVKPHKIKVKRVEVEGVPHKVTKYHAWNSRNDATARGDQFAEIERVILHDSATISRPRDEADDDSDAEYVHPATNINPMRRPTGADDQVGPRSTSQGEFDDFELMENDGLYVFPAYLKDNLNRHLKINENLSCARSLHGKGVFTRNDGRKAIFCSMKTGKELLGARFKAETKEFIVVQDAQGESSLANGQAVIVGVTCRSTPMSFMRDGREWSQTTYHVWGSPSEFNHVAHKCTGAEIMKLTEKPQPIVPSTSTSNNYAFSDLTSQNLQLKSSAVNGHGDSPSRYWSPSEADTDINRGDLFTEPLPPTGGIFEKLGNDIDNPSGSKRKADELRDDGDTIHVAVPKNVPESTKIDANLNLSHRKRRPSAASEAQRTVASRSSSPEPTAKRPRPTGGAPTSRLAGEANLRDLNRLRSVTQSNTARQLNSDRRSTWASELPVQSLELGLNRTLKSETLNTPVGHATTLELPHVFLFSDQTGKILRKKPVRVCNKVDILFAHAKAAKIASAATTTLFIDRRGYEREEIVKGDPEDLERLLNILQDVQEPEEILVLADTD